MRVAWTTLSSIEIDPCRMCLPPDEKDGSNHGKKRTSKRTAATTFGIATPTPFLSPSREDDAKGRSQNSIPSTATTLKLSSQSLVSILMVCAILSFGVGHFWSDRVLPEHYRSSSARIHPADTCTSADGGSSHSVRFVRMLQSMIQPSESSSSVTPPPSQY